MLITKCQFCLFFSYQDVHTQSFIMVVASHRWLGVRLDSLSALLTGAVALAALFVSQDAGKYNLIYVSGKWVI